MLIFFLLFLIPFSLSYNMKRLGDLCSLADITVLKYHLDRLEDDLYVSQESDIVRVLDVISESVIP